MDDSPHQVTIQALSHDGRGIALVNNKKTFIEGALNAETVTYALQKKRSSYNEAKLLSVIEKSPLRVEPPCQHFGVCGGCNLQHMNMAAQLDLKQHTLLEQLKHFGRVEPENILPALSAQQENYRRRARLGVKFVHKKNKLLVGFREKSSRYLADIQDCPVLHESVGKKLSVLAATISRLENFQAFPQVEIAVGEHETACVFRHLNPLSSADIQTLITFGMEEKIQIYLEPNKPEKIHKIWPQDGKETLSYTLPDFALEFLFHPLDFTQINLELNRLMVQQTIAFLDLKAHDTVLDLFCGLGNFSLPIAKTAKKVVGVEGSSDMVRRATQNARHNHIQNIEFHTANLTTPQNANWLNARYNKLLLDPPRSGALEVLPFLKNFAPDKIVYVSCNPATLARDAGEIVHQHGYKFKNAGIMNMFPHTAHIEAMAVFEK